LEKKLYTEALIYVSLQLQSVTDAPCLCFNLEKPKVIMPMWVGWVMFRSTTLNLCVCPVLSLKCLPRRQTQLFQTAHG